MIKLKDIGGLSYIREYPTTEMMLSKLVYEAEECLNGTGEGKSTLVMILNVNLFHEVMHLLDVPIKHKKGISGFTLRSEADGVDISIHSNLLDKYQDNSFYFHNTNILN